MSKEFLKIVSNDTIWKNKYWDWFGDGLQNENVQNWKEAFIKTYKSPEISRERLTIKSVKGIGPFKSVYNGEYKFLPKIKYPVAIAVYYSYYLMENKQEVEREIDLMKRLRHPNIIRFFGFTTGKQNHPWIIEGENLGKNFFFLL